MTRDQLMKLTPGPATDLVVAEALGDLVVPGDVAQAFSRSYDAAWRIVEHFRSRGWLVRVQEMPTGMPWLHNDKHEVHKRSVCILYPMCVGEDPSDTRISAYADTSCMAIIRALFMCQALHQSVEGQPTYLPGGTHGDDRQEVQDSGGAGHHEGEAHGAGLRVVPREG